MRKVTEHDITVRHRQ